MLNRRIAPPYAKSSSFNLIKPEERTLQNGMQVFFVPGGSQDVLKIELVFPAGRWWEARTGAAHFTAHLLSKGTAKKTSFEIAQVFDQFGAHLEVSPGTDFLSVSLYALGKKLDVVLPLLAEILLQPAFPEKEFEQSQSIFIQNLKINNEKTSYVASKLFRRNLFGKNHPYGRETEEADVRGLRIADLKKHYDRHIQSPIAFVSGKIDAAIKNFIVDTLEAFPPGKAPETVVHDITATPENQHLKKDDTVQSSVRTGKRFPQRHHPDYVPVLFVSHILGGYFGSRLMKNIREEKGLTYGISASIHGMKHDSYLLIDADVNKENVDLTFEEIRKELRNLRTTKVPASELETSRNHFIGSLQSEITTSFAHAEKIKAIKLFDLQPGHYQNIIDKIEKISASQIQEIGERYFDESTFFEIAVG